MKRQRRSFSTEFKHEAAGRTDTAYKCTACIVGLQAKNAVHPTEAAGYIRDTGCGSVSQTHVKAQVCNDICPDWKQVCRYQGTTGHIG